MNLVSELVTNQASLSLQAENSKLPEMISIAENMEKVTRQLRDNVFDICLIPLDTIMIRFQRLVRDLSTELNKDIELVTEGTETELDKNIIESLADPIMHILRNSLDHGIESREERLLLGKPEKGKIILKAFYSGMNVYIQIQDDGKGIDTDKIKKKAISSGLISADAILDEKEVFDLLFTAGFSTAERVTDVSGRGVGMDVVKRKISDIRGSVEIDSRINEGTTITIKLPLTLSIIDGLLVKINNTFFVIQLPVVDKVYEIKTADLLRKSNRQIPLDGELIPCLYLREEFNMAGDSPERSKIILVKYNDQRIGLSVDEIIGEYQAVLKPLDKLFSRQDFVSGAAILGDGTVALVLDTNLIVDMYDKENGEASRSEGYILEENALN
jgi:two-component system chemotaxis sensor kinase CheA